MNVTETQTPQILFVDDEPDLQILLRQKFRKRIKSGEMTTISPQEVWMSTLQNSENI